MDDSNKENGILKWRFDISTFRLIGRDLITDRITALFELVKNCYDANATRVDVIFEKISYDQAITNPVNDQKIINPNSKIAIKDNGYGMSFADIKDKWMVIGTSSKRKSPYSPDPFNRKCVGEKGIGRFAVDKLGDKVNIITKKKGDSKWLNVEIDWNLYFKQTHEINEEKITLFTDIENGYSYVDSPSSSNESGTILEMTSIREYWSKQDIQRFYKEASKIVSPYIKLNPPFHIFITADEYDIVNWEVKSEKIDYATIVTDIGFNSESLQQESLYFNSETGVIEKKEISIPVFGGISLKLFYFDENARRNYHRVFKNENNKIDGIKIYRDGIITTPFAETEANPDKKRDILGVDKRLWQDIFNRISTREIIGILDITKVNNPAIIDATNRQDFIDNEEYRALKDFIILQLKTLEQWKIYQRKQKRASVDEGLKIAKTDVETFANVVNKVVKSNPNLESELKPLLDQAIRTSSSVKKAIKEQKQAEKEYVRKENMYLSIMSLQEYAIHIAHAVRTSLGKIQRKAEFFYKYYPDPEEEAFFKLYSKEIFQEMLTLDYVINFMLSYSRSNLNFEELKIKEVVENLFYSYRTIFEEEYIRVETIIPDNLVINSNRQFFIDIIQNIISNSIKALQGIKDKIIKCSGYVEDSKFILCISDNGCGIPIEKREWVFGIYNTTTEEDGGAGVGLYIVKTRVESLQGTVEIIDSEFGDIGTTIRILLPFKK